MNQETGRDWSPAPPEAQAAGEARATKTASADQGRLRAESPFSADGVAEPEGQAEELPVAADTEREAGAFQRAEPAAEALLAPAGEVEVSVVMPCLNEHETVGICVQKALDALTRAGLSGEVIVADNGSTDGSIEIATSLGARVVPVRARGYGNALRGGIEAARGRYVIMADADDSYDFSEVPRFVAELRKGYDLVQGCRLPSGGGTVLPGAMPWLHRWLGNPVLSWLARVMFRTRIKDIYCGMRGFTREAYNKLDLRSAGMEFATEMIIKASLFGQRIHQIPITLSPDGRRVQRPHLRTFRDGWRTLRFFLIFSPRWLFWHPGLALIFLGVLGYAVALPGLTVAGATFDAHTLLVSSMLLMVGTQAAMFAILTTTYAVMRGFLPPSPRVDRFFEVFTLERGAVAGLAGILVGFAFVLGAVVVWTRAGFGNLDYATTMRVVVPGVTMVTLGTVVILNSFLCSILALDRR
jgi:glycosyltransferase involved in cell wall biosynthesis